MILHPIETAPKDGTEIVGYYSEPDGRLTAAVTWWGDSTRIYHPVWGQFKQSEWWLKRGGGAEWFDPEYWHPLPLKPKE